MAAFQWRGGKVRLIRNHEAFQPGNVGAFGDVSEAYDLQGPGGTTTLETSPRAEEVRSWVSLNGTSFNCAGGASPWGSWITCEETPNGVDQQRSFLIGPGDPDDLNYEQKHGYLYEVPVSRGLGELEVAEPITQAGRFAHEAAAVDPSAGTVYMTEDDFAYPSGFFRYVPPNNPFKDKRVADGGQLQVLGVVPDGAAGPVTADLHTDQTPGITYQVAWIDIDDPDPQFLATALGVMLLDRASPCLSALRNVFLPDVDTLDAVVRPGSCIELAGGSPVPVGTGAPGSRPRSVAERRRAKRGVESLFGGSKRAGRSVKRILQPRHSHNGRAEPLMSRRRPCPVGLVLVMPGWVSPGYGEWHVRTVRCGTGEARLLGLRRAKTQGISRW